MTVTNNVVMLGWVVLIDEGNGWDPTWDSTLYADLGMAKAQAANARAQGYPAKVAEVHERVWP